MADHRSEEILANGTNHDEIVEDLEDYKALETELDNLNSCLSVIEGWNENLHSECVKLLERAKELRRQANQSGV